MPDIKFLPGFCSVTTGAQLNIDAEDTVAPDFEPLVQQVVETTVEPYVVIDGRPQPDSVHGARLNATGGSNSYTVHETAPLPEELDLGTWRRWLPYAEWLTAPEAGGRRWWPIETAPGDMVPSGWGESGQAEPRTALYTTIPTSGPGSNPTGRGTYDPLLSPGIDEGYSYRGYDREMFRNAMVLEGEGHLSIETERTFTDTTFGIVVVFHPSDLPNYGVYASNEVDPYVGTPGEPLVLRYSQGLFEVYQAHVRVLRHETHKSAHQGVIILLSLSATTNSGRALIIDNTRTSREFNIDNMDFVSFGGMIGAEGQVTAEAPVTRTAVMDILEFGIWDYAMDFPELEEKANLLSLAYGIAG